MSWSFARVVRFMASRAELDRAGVVSELEITNMMDLATLADQINAEHRACDEALRKGLAHAVRAGELLVEAKAQVKHGQWEQWVAQNFEGSARTAQAYMKVAREIPTLDGAKAQRVALLSFRGALKELSGPAREQVLGPWTACDTFEEMNQKADAVARGEACGKGQWSENAWYQLSREGRRKRAAWFREVVIRERLFSALYGDEPGFDHWRDELIMLEGIVRPVDLPVGRESFGLLDALTGAQCFRTIAQLEEEGVLPLGRTEEERA